MLHVPQGRLSTHPHAGMPAYISSSTHIPFLACKQLTRHSTYSQVLEAPFPSAA